MGCESPYNSGALTASIPGASLESKLFDLQSARRLQCDSGAPLDRFPLTARFLIRTGSPFGSSASGRVL